MMDEHVTKRKIQKAFSEPRAPEELIQQVILRAKAVTMGGQAQKQLQTAPSEKYGELTSRALIGQLAAVSELPAGGRPEQLAQQLEQQPAFRAALHGGNLSRRLNSGELLRQITGQTPEAELAEPEIPAHQNKGPTLG